MDRIGMDRGDGEPAPNRSDTAALTSITQIACDPAPDPMRIMIPGNIPPRPPFKGE
ncbi:hypothetical protein GCM10011402_37780 [Paracoccus acridae]|uniref:Uncharacterized protein n=1 Tax=Paracoccus acridae TaxID=1795310 RepID=A0ABQ1VPE5_9RHOB|nr:hypothetical protein [Paracoccus acridae]GGF81597.1 hypothetical protein GCM10011402_37780 [Paracoccus acridae]